MTGLGQETHYLAPRTIPLRLLCQNMIVRIVSPGAGNHRRNHVAIFFCFRCVSSHVSQIAHARAPRQACVRAHAAYRARSAGSVGYGAAAETVTLPTVAAGSGSGSGGLECSVNEWKNCAISATLSIQAIHLVV